MDDRPPRPAGPPGHRGPHPPPQDGFLRGRDARELRQSLGRPSGQPAQDGPTRPMSPGPRRPPVHQPLQPPSQRPLPVAGSSRGQRVRTAKIVLAVVSALVLAFTGYAWATFQQLTSNLATTPVIGGAAPDGATDILLVGSDSRVDAQGNPLSKELLAELHAGGNEGELTDTLILVRIPNDGRKAVGISIPRDSFVKIPGGYGQHKINSAYGRAKNATAAELRAKGGKDAATIEREAVLEGRKTLVKAIEDLTGAGIDHYAEVNLLGFYEITKAIGGVDVCLNRATRDADSGANFPAGRQTISGAGALAFVRQRKNLPRGDLDRIVRQQVFMGAVADKVLSAGTLGSPGKLRALVNSLQRSIVLDDRLDPMTFANQMRGIASGAVQFVTIPVLEIGAKTADGDSVTVDEDAVRAFVREQASGGGGGEETSTVDNSAITVDVRNASGAAGLAGRVLDELADRGFTRGEAANASARATSVVRHATGKQAAAAKVAEALGGLPTEEDANLAAGRVSVFLGEDYGGPGAQRFGAAPLVHLDGPPALRAPALGAQPNGDPPSGDPPITGGDIRCVD